MNEIQNISKKINIKQIIRINVNTPICIFSPGMFTKACGSKSTPTRKCRSCFPGRMSSVPVTTVPKGTTYFLSSKKK
jgi:hypothetical protein